MIMNETFRRVGEEAVKYFKVSPSIFWRDKGKYEIHH
jgi:hypothetical protein